MLMNVKILFPNGSFKLVSGLTSHDTTEDLLQKFRKWNPFRIIDIGEITYEDETLQCDTRIADLCNNLDKFITLKAVSVKKCARDG